MLSRAAVLAFLAFSSPVLADDLIFADLLNFNDPLGNSIRRVGTDGSNLVTLIATGGGVRGIDVDAAGGWIYWSDVDNFVIRRARFDGSDQQDLVTTGLAFPAGLRISVPTGAMFWGDASNEEMYHANIDGSNPVLMASTIFYRGMAVDEANARIYWTSSVTATTGRLQSSDFFGNGQVTILGNPIAVPKPGSIAIGGGKIYWTEQVARVIKRANLDGSSIEPLFNAANLGPPKGIAVDTKAGKVYWGQDIEGEGFERGEIYKMNLDGTLIELVATDLGSVNDIIIVRGGGGGCYPNCDGSTGQPALTANDFQCFINKFAANDTYANCDGSTGTPSLTANDFQCFINKYAGGCR